MAAPTIVSASSTTVASGTSITINAPSSISRGNILIAVIATTSSSVLATPSDWIRLNLPANGEASYWKTAGSSEPADYTWTWTTSSVGCGLIVQITGNSISPIEASNAQANGSSVNITAPTLTPFAKTDLLVNIYATNTANTITVPAGQNNIGGTTGNSRAIICGYQTLADSYATGTITSNGTNVSNNDTVTIGGKVYTFKTTLTPAEGEILIGGTASDSLTNLANAINYSGGTPGTDYQVGLESSWVTSSAPVANVITLTSISIRTIGNSTTLAKSAATLTLSGATLSGAVNGNDATGTRVATSSAAINYGFSFVIKEPFVVGNLMPAGEFSSINFLPSGYSNAPVVGIGAGPSFLSNSGMYYGRYKLVVNTQLAGINGPGYKVVVTRHGQENVVLRSGITNTTGILTFTDLAPGYYTVYGVDMDDVRRGAIADYIEAVAM